MSFRQLRKALLLCLYCIVHVLKICYFFRFVLYQMSKNMNRRIFYMFLVRLASVPEPAACNISSRDHVFKHTILEPTGCKYSTSSGNCISKTTVKCWWSACNISSMDCLFQNIIRVRSKLNWFLYFRESAIIWRVWSFQDGKLRENPNFTRKSRLRKNVHAQNSNVRFSRTFY